MTSGWKLAGDARRDFADMVDTLTAEQVNAPTLCDGWSVHDVAGHVATFIDIPLPKFMLNVISSLGNFDKASTKMARKMAERPIGELTASIRDQAEKPSPLKAFPGELTALDTIAHTQDVRRALDLPGAPSPEALEAVLRFATTDKKAGTIIKKGSLDGLRFEATDIDWSHGDGELVKGTAEAVLMAMLSRDVGSDVSGDGVATLAQRKTT